MMTFSTRAIPPLSLIMLATGCHQAHLTVCDAFQMNGEPSSLSARVESHSGGGRMAPIPNVMVNFFVHDQRVGQAVTNADGVAGTMCPLPARSNHFRTEAIVAGEKLCKEALVFGFPKGRTTVVCDIDETVSLTHYRELVFDSRDDMWSKPFPDAAATLTELSKHYGIVYLTARPGFLLEKTKRWLDKNGFPFAPVVTTPSLAQSIRVQRFKADRIMHLESVLGTVCIGIGNATTDSEAYAMQNLLTLIIDNHDDSKFRAHAVILRNWKMIRAFFNANEAVLSDPTKLRTAVREEQMLMRPLIRYEKAH